MAGVCVSKGLWLAGWEAVESHSTKLEGLNVSKMNFDIQKIIISKHFPIVPPHTYVKSVILDSYGSLSLTETT